MPPAKRGRSIDSNQTFRRATERNRFSTGQTQFRDDAPRALGKRQSRRRGAYRVCTANEQLTADRAFQAIDTPGYR
ncbi:hypothetical protein D3C71_1797570 [compost metagenome]